MSDDGKRKPPPPRFPRPGDPELVRVSEDKAPDTERVPVVPLEPFRLLKGREASYTEIAAQLQGVGAAVGQVIVTQKRQAQQLDGFGRIINERFDIFHRELALLRVTVTGDHEPRLGKVEATMSQKAVKGGSIVGVIVLALPLLADALPRYRHLIEAIQGWFQ